MDEKTLVSIIEKVKNGFDVERTNIDLKRQWWHFEKVDEYEEFLKDICAMANTQSSNSYIVLGVDESGVVFDAPIPDDEANIQSRHKDAIEPRIKLMVNEYLIEGKTISVITIPHSANRPHMIKKYKDQRFWIPIRFGSSTLTASRSDLDEMYNERDKTHTPQLKIRLFEDKIRWGDYPTFGSKCLLVRLTVDNYEGGAPDYIVKAEMRQNGHEHVWRTEQFMFEGHQINQEVKINAHERKQGLQLYLGFEQEVDQAFERLSDQDLKLSFYTRSGESMEIPVKWEWVMEK